MFKFKKDQEVLLRIGGEPTTSARILQRLREDVDGEATSFYRVDARGNDAHRNADGELWVTGVDIKEASCSTNT